MAKAIIIFMLLFVGMEWFPLNVGMNGYYIKGNLVATTIIPSEAKSLEETVSTQLNIPERENLVAEHSSPLPKLNSQVSESKNVDTKSNMKVQELLQAKMTAWLNAWSHKSNLFFDFYDKVKFGQISALKDVTYPKNQYNSFNLLKNEMLKSFNSTWIDVSSRQIISGEYNGYLYTQSELFIRIYEKVATQGILRLYWNKNDAGEYQIVDSTWREKMVDMESDYIAAAAPLVVNMILDWQNAWLNSNVDSYANFYTDNAQQQNIRGKKNIANHKHNIWKTTKPKEIILSDLHIALDPKGFLVYMNQQYTNSNGYADEGTKYLLLQPNLGRYLILSERWMPLVK